MMLIYRLLKLGQSACVMVTLHAYVILPQSIPLTCI